MTVRIFGSNSGSVLPWLVLGSLAGVALPAARAQQTPAAASAPEAPPPSSAAAPDASVRALTIEDALALGIQNNRDLLAARERLRGSYSDVERALSTLLPSLSLQGKLTLNYPAVSLTLDQSGAVFQSAYQAAQVLDLNKDSAAMGPATQTFYNAICLNNTVQNPPGVQAACQALANPGTGNASAASIQKAFNGTASAANIVATLVPTAQLDGFLNLAMPLIAPPSYPALKGARLNFKSQEKQLEATAAQILTTVASSFYSVAGNEEVVVARRHGIEVAQKTLETAQVRLSAGVVNKVEVTRAALALIQTEQRLLEAQDALAAAYRTLATSIHVPPGSFKVVPPPEPSVDLPNEDQLVDKALHQRPELLSTQLQIGSYGQQAFSSLLRWAPSLSLFGNIHLTNATGFGGRIDYYAAGLELDWTIFDGFLRDSQRHSFEAQKRDAELRLDQLRDSIADDVVSGRRAVLTRKQGLITAQRSVEMSQETLELVRTQYQAGTATQLDLLNAQDNLIQSEVGVAQARFDLSLAVLNIKRLTGDTLTSK